MRKIFPLILSICILLCACDNGAGPGKEADSTASPTPTAEPIPIYSPDISGESGVFTDWGKLTPYDAGTQIYTRIGEGPLTELKASGDYSMLLPYVGAHIFTYGEWGGLLGDKYGLVTMDGRIVLDPVLSRVHLVNWYDENTQETKFLDVYVLSVMREDAGGIEGYSMVQAVSALDGSWSTDFEYGSTFGTSRGVICEVDSERNHAVCYNEEGGIVFDTRDFPDIDKLAPNNIWGMDWPQDDWARVWLEDKGCGFLSPEGRLMRQDGEIARFDSANLFSEGLAPVMSGNLWGYIDIEGSYVIEPQYSFAESFHNGKAIVNIDDVYCVIDTLGNVLMSFDGDSSVYSTTDIFGKMYYQAYSENKTVSYDQELVPLMINGILAETYGMGLYAEDEHGIWIRFKNKDTYIINAETFNGMNREGSLACVILNDGSYAVVNSDGQMVMSSQGYIFFTDDKMTDRQYIAVESGNYQTCTIYDESGQRLVTDAMYSEPVNGLFQCEDELFSGWKNSENEWVFRISVDAGD